MTSGARFKYKLMEDVGEIYYQGIFYLLNENEEPPEWLLRARDRCRIKFMGEDPSTKKSIHCLYDPDNGEIYMYLIPTTKIDDAIVVEENEYNTIFYKQFQH